MSAAEELARRRTKRRRTPLEHVKFKDAQPRLTDRSVIKGWLERDQLSLIFGPTGCGKTFLTLDLSLHVAWGRAWGGSRVVQGAVVYVAVEAGKSISNRLVAFRQHHRLEALDLPFHAVTSPIDLCHLDVGDVVLLGKLIREVADLPALVVIDTVSRAMAGGNENSPDDMGAFIGALDLLRERLGCHVLAVHHVGKDRDRGARGHSSLFCAIDTAIEVDKQNGVSTATVVKQRDGPVGVVRAFRLQVVELGRDGDGDPVTSCVLEWTDAPVKASGNEKKFLDVLNETIERDGTDNKLGRIVKHDVWRSACSAGWTGKPNSFRTVFGRARDKLTMRTGPVGSKGDLVWIKKQGQFEIDDEAF